MKTFVFIITFTMLLSGWLTAQEPLPSASDTTKLKTLTGKTPSIAERRMGEGGIGFGLDYGGVIGVKASFNALPVLALFAAGGIQLTNDFGWNVGVLGRLFPADGIHSARPYLKVMYGVNGATKVQGLSDYDEIFTGLTAGVGVEIRLGRKKNNGFNFDLNFPFRSPEFYKQVNEIKNDPRVTDIKGPYPVAFSVGYQFEF